MRHCRTDSPTARYEPSTTRPRKNESDLRMNGGEEIGATSKVISHATAVVLPQKNQKHRAFSSGARISLYTRQKRPTPKPKPKRRKQAVLPRPRGHEHKHIIACNTTQTSTSIPHFDRQTPIHPRNSDILRQLKSDSHKQSEEGIKGHELYIDLTHRLPSPLSPP